MSEPRYLWFAPHAGLWPSFRLEHRLAEQAARAGRSITMIRCDGVLDSYCPVMSAERLHVTSPAAERQRACRDCQHNAGITGAAASYARMSLDAFVDEGVRAAATEVMAGVDERTWSELELGGIPIGRYASYLTMLHHKVPDVTATEAAWREYTSDLRNALHVALATPRILDEVDPTHAVVYNPLYPTSRMFVIQAQRRGAQLVGLHAGSYIPARYDTVGIYPHISASQTLVDSPTIRASLDVPCTPGEVAAVGAQMRQLMAGSDPWVYSSAHARRDPNELRAALGLRADAPVVVALLSSPDETRSSMLVDAEYHRDPERGYSDIAEFIDEIHALAARLPDVDVVLRLHPRLMPNKRESVSSPDLAAILRSLEGLPSNAHVNGPGDGVSLYDLIGIADAGLNQSSSSGLELMALGLPVVSYDPVRQNAYPPEFGPSALRGDRVALEAAVREALAAGGSLDNSVRAFRWYASVYLRAMLHLARLVPDEVTPKVAAPPAAPAAGPALPASMRRFVPEGVRERAARWGARRARAATLPDPDADAVWRTEWLQRLDATSGDDVIWRPPIIVRGIPDPEQEAANVAAAVADLRELLGFTLGRGFGPAAG